jgi:hypothetical protein
MTDTMTSQNIVLSSWDTLYIYTYTRVLISPYPGEEGNKLQQQKILSFLYPIYNHNWRNINTIYIYIFIYLFIYIYTKQD